MIRLANVLVVSAGRPEPDDLCDSLIRAGYGVASAATDGALRRAASERPDVVLIADSGDGLPFVALGKAFKDDGATADIPVVLAAGTVGPELCAAALDAGLDDVIAIGCAEVELLARIRPLGRLSTMLAELRQRARTAAAFGVSARGQVALGGIGGRPRVLVAGDDPDAASMPTEEADLVVAANLFEAEDMLTRRGFDAAILSARRPGEAEFAFCTQVRHNPALFNLPIVLIAGSDQPPSEAYRHGATRLLTRADHPAIVRAAVLTLVRRQKLRWSIREALGDSLAGAAKDPGTQCYSAAFLDAYLAERVATAAASGRHLAVLCFHAANVDAVGRQFGADAASLLTGQIGRWIAGLVRAEDLVARTRDHEFCVALPDTPLAEAETVMHRIAGVLAYTDFAVPEVYQPVKTWVQVGAAAAREGDDAGTVTDRARRNMG
ncbi:MAG: diguanylate cyclase [Magnetospirillum sp.]|nr:diguanylate cyclase [Magnetospirillum sp.]